jgi:chlorophyll(ide) b reductase
MISDRVVFKFPPMTSTLLKMSPTASSSSSAGGVVITGGANGVGFAYAGEFMDRGFDVVICDIQDSTTAAKALAARHPNGRIFHTKCDVSDAASVQKLGIFAKENLGTINHWINNAGINGGRRSLREVPFGAVEAVVKVNLLGILYCTKVAMDIMADQVSFSCFGRALVLKTST